MSQKSSSTVEMFQKKFKKQEEEKLLEEALIYLKLREVGCPKMKALIFTKKKPQGVDTTVRKDGPAGFRRLVPEKPDGIITNGWLKGQKLTYQGLRGFSEEVVRNISKQKKSITSYNQIDRRQMELIRQKRIEQNAPILNSNKGKALLQQIGNLKDEILKDKEKRNLYLSYSGQRLEEFTRQFFQQADQINSESLIMKLSAFNDHILDENLKIQTDWQVAKGRTLSSYEIEGDLKRKSLINFRHSLSSFKLPKVQEESSKQMFRRTLQNSQRQGWNSGNFQKRVSKEKKGFLNREFKEFNENLQKIYHIKSKGLALQ